MPPNREPFPRAAALTHVPIYEYRCQECGRVFEALILRASDTLELVCESCGARDVERVLSAISALPRSRSGGCGPSRSPFS